VFDNESVSPRQVQTSNRKERVGKQFVDFRKTLNTTGHRKFHSNQVSPRGSNIYGAFPII
jgi:hypothetical protein